MKMRKLRVLGPVIFLGVMALAITVVMLLWNSVVVNIFDLPTINFWYSAGLIILCKILFGGFRPHHHHGFAGRRRGKCKAGHSGGTHVGDDDDPFDVVREMHDRFHSMSREERREHIRHHMRHGFGHCCGNDPKTGGNNTSSVASGEAVNDE